jgi:acetyltransferase-like isoleucine patch superfamily enzyme
MATPVNTSLSAAEKRDLLARVLQQRTAQPRRVPLSRSQERVWRLIELEPDSPVYNVAFAYELNGPLDAAALERAIQAVARRHESLRTAFALADGKPVQAIGPGGEVRLERVDLTALPAAEWPEAARRLASEIASAAVDLTRPPLWRFTLLKRSDDCHWFLVNTHHIISDRWSVGLVIQELSAEYAARVQGGPSPLSPAAASYADATARLEAAFSEQDRARELAYWRDQFLDGPRELALPTDLRPAVAPSYRGARRTFALPVETAGRLNALAAAEGVTAYVVLLAAVAARLHRDTGQTDLVLITPVSGRHHAATRGVVGYFNNLLPIRVRLAGCASFRDVVRAAGRAVKGAFDHQDIPFQEIAALPGMDRLSLARCFVSVQNVTSLALKLPGVVSSYYDVPNDTANFDLAVCLEEYAGTYRGIVDAKTDLWSAAALDQFLGRFLDLLSRFVDQPDGPLADGSDPSTPQAGRPRADGEAGRMPPAPALPGAEPAAGYVAPRTAVERTTAAVWARTLGLERVGIHDNFYQCGGHSLVAASIISQLRDTFDVDLPLGVFRQAPTVAGLAARIESLVQGGAAPPVSAPAPAPVQSNGVGQPVAEPSGAPRKRGWTTRDAYRFLALSKHPVARAVRKLYHAVTSLSVPAPRLVVKPMLWAFLALRATYYFGLRVFICEPLFKASCKQYGRRLRTGEFIHWVQGVGDIILGDDLVLDGKCSFTFAARFAERPTLVIGDRTVIGHQCSFVVGKRITIGRDCLLAWNVRLFDTSGHPLDPEARRRGEPCPPEDVQPIVIGDNVWIGQQSVIFPGVTIGDGSVVSACSVVRANVPPYTVVSGNPAVPVGQLPRPAKAPG